MMILFFGILLALSNRVPTTNCNGVFTNFSITKHGNESTCRSSHECPSLQYLLTNFSLPDRTNVSLFDSQNISMSITVKDVNGLIISGADSSLKITCDTKLQTCLEFFNCTNVNIFALNWFNVNPSSTNSILFTDSTDVAVTKNNFTDSCSGLTLKNVRGTIKIVDSHFHRYHHQSVHPVSPLLNITMMDSATTNSIYSILNCTFNGTGNASPTTSGTKSAGGGIYLKIEEGIHNINITFEYDHFNDNRASVGGGVYVQIHSGNVGISVSFLGCHFNSNSASEIGGGLYIEVDKQSESGILMSLLNHTIGLYSCEFYNNSAHHAGGMGYQTVGGQFDETVSGRVSIINTKFEENQAQISAAAAGFFKWNNGIAPVIEMTNCLITKNYESNYLQLYSNQPVTNIGTGILYTQEIPIAFSGNTDIHNNHGTAILASSASIYMEGNVTMESNTGIRGGAINLVGNSRIVIKEGLNLTFQDNHAELYGGAVYHIFPVTGVSGKNQYCIFQYYKTGVVNPTEWDAIISFINNSAFQAGQSVYLSSPDSCHSVNDNKIFTENTTFFFEPKYYGQVMTPPINISFISNNCCSHNNVTGSCKKIDAMFGERIRVGIKATDAFNQTLKSVMVAIELACIKEDGTKPFNDDSCVELYSLGGSNVTEMTEQVTQVPFYIKGTNTSNSAKYSPILIWHTIQQPSAVGILQIHITNCYQGYVYDEHEKICRCYNKMENVIYCNETDYTACVNTGYWYGPIHDTSPDNLYTKYTAYPCPFGYCNYTVAGTCPTSNCGGQGSAHQFYCSLPRVSSDSLCLYKRGKILCSGCSHNHYLSFDGIKCVAKEKCNNNYIALYVFIIFFFWIGTIIVFSIIAKLDLRIGSGYLYAFVFFFSVLQYFVHGLFPSTFLFNMELFLTGFMQLDPKIFGLFQMCAIKSVNNLEFTATHYIYPLLLVSALMLFVYASRKWPNYAPFSRQNSAINLICIVTYLVFISLTQTSLAMLAPIAYPGINNHHYVVSIEPKVKYFDKKRHLPYGLIALLIQVVFVIPFLVLLLFSPWLMKIRRLNLTRIKPILDEYQACYKTKYRSFVGFYLTCRQLIYLIDFLTNIFNVSSYMGIYILQILSILILTIHCLIQPYNSLHLNILDGLIILDLVLLSILHGNTANVVFAKFLPAKTVIVHILVLLPVVYIIGLCLFLLVSGCMKRRKKRVRRSHSRQSSHPTSHPSDRAQDEKLEREPLLFNTGSGLYGSSASASVNAAANETVISAGLVQKPQTVSVVYLESKD